MEKTKKNPNASPETGQPESSSKSYREAMDEFFGKRKDFSKCGGNVSAVLPQGSPSKEDPKPEDSDEE